MMTKQIETHTLREWLDAHQPVTVLDIRTDDDRIQWAIPGSLHVNAYEALQNGQPGALAHLVIPADRPVVTVCNAGKVSQIAAEMLANRGFDAQSLAGGMKAWSLYSRSPRRRRGRPRPLRRGHHRASKAGRS